jgi:AraC-like DNA-binding protein
MTTVRFEGEMVPGHHALVWADGAENVSIVGPGTITHVRLREAKTLLRYTPDKIAAVAEKCGFQAATYFCRWIRKHTGKTARELRQSD